jgi:hypothetical protein
MSNARRIADLLDSSGDVLGTNLDNVTTYSVGDGGLTTNDFTDADHTKLNAIEASATADQTGAEIKTAYEAEANAYTDTKDTKLSGIATSANNYSHPSGAGNSHIPTGGSVDQLLTNTASGTGTWQDAPVSLPSQTGNANKQLTTDGSTASWADTSITLDSPSITGTLSIDSGGTVSHTISNWSDDVSYTITPTNCTVGAVNSSGVFVVTHTSGNPSYTIVATTDSLGLDNSSTVTKNIVMNLSAPTLSSPADVGTATDVVYTITSTDSNDDKLILDMGSSNFTYSSVSVGTASKVGNTVECIGFTTNNPAVTIQFTAEATYSVTAKSVNIAGTYGDSASSSADSITIAPQTYNIEYLVIGGGGGSGGTGQGHGGGGGGAGGYRNSYSSETSGGGGASETAAAITTGVNYTVTIGAGGAGTTAEAEGQPGTSSVFGSITSVGGGFGGGGSNDGSERTPGNGGSGGGAGSSDQSLVAGGSGTANQGYAGAQARSIGNGTPGPGGGAGAAGIQPTTIGSNPGGLGLASSITGVSATRGVGGNVEEGPTSGVVGAANTGDGGGSHTNGGSGVVILRMLTTKYSGTTTGSPAVSTSGSDTILTFNGDGTYTA